MKRPIFTLWFIVLILSACAPTVQPLVSQNGIEIYQVSIRLPGGGASGTKSDTAILAGYMLIKNTGSTNESLVGVHTDFTDTAMFHESSVNSNGVASMKMRMSVDVPAGQTVEFKPGGLHIMFTGLKQNLKVGDTVTLIFQFQNAGAISVPVEVTDR